jgi:curli production assembly/transport component CsgG
MYLSPPGGVDNRSYMGESTPSERDFKKLPQPKNKTVVGVYKFRDQTGQYKESNSGANWSTAIPQGLTSILIKSLEESQWFSPVERENLGNLLNERQIIQKTRRQYNGEKASNQLPPLLFAGTLLEGGVVSYDSNILTGGAGARYFGIGGSTEYRQDRITVYLRAVSTSTGKVLKTVYTSKTILSQSLDVSMFRYVDPERILEAEIGITNNEPTQMAVTEAINKAVYLLILNGIEDNLWQTNEKDSTKSKKVFSKLDEEIVQSNTKVPGKGLWNRDRSNFSFGLGYTFNGIRSDYSNSQLKPGVRADLIYAFSDCFSIDLSIGYQKLENKNFFKSEFLNYDMNLEYLTLPHNAFSPFFFGGLGMIYDLDEKRDRSVKFKTQFGGGIEYMFSNTIGLRGRLSYNLGFDDDWDQLEAGKINDHFLQIGLGLKIDLGNL